MAEKSTTPKNSKKTVNGAPESKHVKNAVAEPAEGSDKKYIIPAAIILLAVAALYIAYHHMPAYNGNGNAPVVSGSTPNSTVTTTPTRGYTTVGSSMPFSPGCDASTGFTCTNAVVTTYGLVSFTFSQSMNSTLYDIHLACATNLNGTQPVNTSSWAALMSDGTFKSQSFGGTSISGTGINVTGLQCYGPNGEKINGLEKGTEQLGYLLINYTSAMNSPGSAGNPWKVAVLAAFNLNATSP